MVQLLNDARVAPLAVYLVLPLLFPCGGFGQTVPENLRSRTPVQLSTEYLAVVEELDASVGMDSGEIMSAAGKVANLVRPRLLALSQAAGTVPGSSAKRSTDNPAGIQRLGKRYVADDQIIPLVETLGEVDRRLTTAVRWTEYALKDERFKVYTAKREVEARNLAEMRRVYAELQFEIAARQAAAYDLWRLSTGQTRVVATASYGAGPRSVTEVETLAFAANLQAAAMSPIRVRPPVMTNFKELYSMDRVLTLGDQSAGLKPLARLVRTELEFLADGHLACVQRALAGNNESERVQAVMSVGWWDKGARKIVEAALDDPSENVRSAALMALGRVNQDEHSLQRLAVHERAAVRLVTVRLAEQRLDDLDVAMRTIVTLLQDNDDTVRSAAYTACDRVLEFRNDHPAARLKWFNPVVSARTPKLPRVVIDAIHWVARQGGGLDDRVQSAQAKFLTPLAGSQDQAVRTAAIQSLQQLQPLAKSN